MKHLLRLVHDLIDILLIHIILQQRAVEHLDKLEPFRAVLLFLRLYRMRLAHLLHGKLLFQNIRQVLQPLFQSLIRRFALCFFHRNNLLFRRCRCHCRSGVLSCHPRNGNLFICSQTDRIVHRLCLAVERLRRERFLFLHRSRHLIQRVLKHLKHALGLNLLHVQHDRPRAQLLLCLLDGLFLCLALIFVNGHLYCHHPY